jgi:predicted acyltransferase
MSTITAVAPQDTRASHPPERAALPSPSRVASIDALRGFVMFTMIVVNDLAGAGKIVPPWLGHFHGKDGMTFVDLVFPAFLFIVGMSIPFALGGRLRKGEPLWRIGGHVLLRTLALLMLGILMVNGSPNTQALGWSGAAWSALMYGGAILAFIDVLPFWADRRNASDVRRWKYTMIALRLIGFALLVWLAFAFRGRRGQRIITLQPFAIRHSWYGILGLIGWAYFVASAVFLCFRGHRTALLGCVALLMCLYAADHKGLFDNWHLPVDIGGTLGSQAAITVAGVLLGSILIDRETIGGVAARIRFTLLFMIGFAAAAVLTRGLYGISKNNATPAWCLWSCAITAGCWLVFYPLADVLRPTRPLMVPFVIAGANVLLAYLLSEGLDSFLGIVHLGEWYDRLAQPDLTHALARSMGCAAVLLALTALLNRAGVRLKL